MSGRERVDVGAGGDAAEIPLGGQVRGDHGGDFRRDRHAGRDGLAQPGAQVVPEDEEADDLHGDRPELVRERAGRQAELPRCPRGPDRGKLEELLAGLGAAIDALGGGFTMNYATVAVTAARTP